MSVASAAKRWVWGLILLLPVVAIACQGDGGEGPSASPTPASPVAGDPTPSSEATPPGPALESLPEGFPVYEGATLVITRGLGPIFTAEYETTDPREQVAGFFKEALDQAPWRVVDVQEPEGWPGSLILFVTRDDSEVGGSVSVSQSTIDPQKIRIVAAYGRRASIFPLATPTSTP